MKLRIKQNVWGNWHGYTGRMNTHDFGTDEIGARYWLAHGVQHNADACGETENVRRYRAAIDACRAARGEQPIYL